MPDESLRRAQARQIIQDGKLPRCPPDRTWGGPGQGNPCVVCAEPIPRDQMAYEIEFARDGSTPGPDTFELHIRCFAAWELERTKP